VKEEDAEAEAVLAAEAGTRVQAASSLPATKDTCRSMTSQKKSIVSVDVQNYTTYV
jgi:hypothetical protein